MFRQSYCRGYHHGDFSLLDSAKLYPKDRREPLFSGFVKASPVFCFSYLISNCPILVLREAQHDSCFSELFSRFGPFFIQPHARSNHTHVHTAPRRNTLATETDFPRRQIEIISSFAISQSAMTMASKSSKAETSTFLSDISHTSVTMVCPRRPDRFVPWQRFHHNVGFMNGAASVRHSGFHDNFTREKSLYLQALQFH